MEIRTFVQHCESAYRERALFLLLIRLAWLATAAALLLILLDAAFALPGSARLALAALGLAALAGCVAWSARLIFRSRAFAQMLVRMVEEGHPELENTLTNALDFEARLEGPGAAAYSRDLMHRAIANAGERAVDITEYSALTPPTLKKEAWALAGLVVLFLAGAILVPAVYSSVIPRYLLPFGDYPPYSPIQFAVGPGNTTVDYGGNLKIEITATKQIPENLTLAVMNEQGRELETIEMHNAGEGVFFMTMENLQFPFGYMARAGKARTRRYVVSLNTIPRIEDVVVSYEYPAYTFRDPVTTVLSEGLLMGHAGTQVTLRIRSNRPLRGGHVAANGQTYPASPGPELHLVEVTFPLEAAGSFSAGIEDIEGHAAPEGVRGTIAIIPDEKPEVVIANPGMDSFAVPDSEVPILVDATDDLGITKMALFRRHNESDDIRKYLYEDEGRNSFVTADETLNLKDLGVKPGDTIDYYATATDSHPDRPQTATSQMYRLQIISFEEYRAFAQSQMTAQDLREKYAEIQEEMEALAEEQRKLKEEIDALREKLAREGALSEAEQEQLAQAEQAQANLAKEAADLAERLKEMADRPVVFDIENEYKDALRDFAERLAEASERMEQARQQMADAGQREETGEAGDAGDSGEGAQPDPPGDPGELGALGEPGPPGAPGETGPSPSGAQAPQTAAQRSLQRASEAQQEALEQLAQNVAQFQEGIQKAGENLERVANVMADVEQFKYLYELQKSLERSIGYYKEMKDPGPEDQARLDELSEQQAVVMESLAELKENLRAHADELDALAQQHEAESDGLPQE